MSGIVVTETKYVIYSDVTVSGTYSDPVTLYDNGVYQISDGGRVIKIKSISNKHHKVVITDGDTKKVYDVHGSFVKESMRYREKKRSLIPYDCYRHITSYLADHSTECNVLVELLDDPLHYVIDEIEAREGSFHPVRVEKYMGKYLSEWNRVCISSFISFVRANPHVLTETIKRMRK